MINPPQVLPEEPTAVTPHGGFCGGKSQQWLRYPTKCRRSDTHCLTPNAHHRSMRFLRLLVDERRAAVPEASLNRLRGMLRIAKRRRSSAWVSKSASTKLLTV